MGSWASGNYGRDRRPTTDELPRIHISDIDGLPLLPNIWITPPTYRIKNLRVSGSRSHVVFGAKTNSGIITIGSVDLIYLPRHFGGHQAYFQCQCGKRVTSLYRDGNGIACRHCHGLLYDSQFSRAHEQPAAKAAKLRAKLGAHPALLKPLPERPKGMHRETYERISYQILAHELAAAQELKRYRDERRLPVLLKMDELLAENA